MRAFVRPRPIRLGAWRRALLLALLVAALALVTSSDTLHSILLRLLTAAEAIIAAHPIWGASLFVLLSALSAMLAFLSTAVIVPVAVYTWGEPLSLLLLWTGWALGGICSYGIGRSLGRQVVTALTSGAALAYGDQISRKAPFGLVFLFQLGLPSEIPGYVLGLVRYQFSKYVLALGLAELPYAVATVYLGASILERRIPVLLGLGAAVALLSTWAFHTLHKRLSTDQ